MTADRTRLALLLLTLVAAVAAGCSSTANQSRDPSATQRESSAQSPSLRLMLSPRSGHWAHYQVDTHGRGIDVYVAHDLQPKPVVILIQGSGCAPIMTVQADETLHDTSLFQDLIAARLNRLHFVLIGKRGVAPLRFSQDMSQQDKVNAFERAERQCSTEYLRNATKHVRVGDTIATVKALASQPWARQIILAGHSEGTHVATGVVRAMSSTEIAAAGLFASAGPTPFYGGYLARGAGDRERFQSIFDQIRMLQRADDDAMYDGLPGRRWKTFWLESTPMEDVRDSIVPLFVAQGSRDDTTLPADLFTLEAIRRQPNRPLRYVVVERADHAFQMPNGRSRLEELFDDFVRWAFDINRQTSLGVLK